MKTYSEINVGDTASIEKTIGESDVYLFAGITGDLNTAHINEFRSKNTKFGGRIVHGMLTGSFFSPILGMHLPGPGTVYLSQTLNFRNVVRIGDTVHAEVTVIEKMEKGRIRFKTVCYNQNGEIAVDGEAVAIAPKDVI